MIVMNIGQMGLHHSNLDLDLRFYDFVVFSKSYFLRCVFQIANMLLFVISGPINSENNNQYENMEIETQKVTTGIS